MAFAKASGYSNLPNGNFSPVIYSQKVQKEFRKTSVCEDITNTDYTGEISQYGDSVRIIKEPEITVSNYARGTTLATQDIADADFTMVVDQANYFQFAIDDIEAAHSHVNFMDLATDRAAYRLADTFDSEVLGYLSGWSGGAGSWARRTAANGTKANTAADADELLAANKLDITDFGGSDLGGGAEVTSIPVAAGGGAGGITSPLALLNRIARKMDQANVDQDGRWVVLDPVFIEMLKDEDSRMLNGDFGGSGLQNGLVLNNIHGFRVYVSNALPAKGTGAGTSGTTAQDANYGVIVAGQDDAVASAEQINKVENYRDPDSFADIVRGMHLYGRKILRPEALITARYNAA